MSSNVLKLNDKAITKQQVIDIFDNQEEAVIIYYDEDELMTIHSSKGMKNKDTLWFLVRAIHLLNEKTDEL